MKIKKSKKVFKITYLQTSCWSWVHLLYVRKSGLAITRDLSYSDLPLTVSWELWTPIKPVQIENVDLDNKSPYEATIIRFRHLCCSSPLKCTHFTLFTLNCSNFTLFTLNCTYFIRFTAFYTMITL